MVERYLRCIRRLVLDRELFILLVYSEIIIEVKSKYLEIFIVNCYDIFIVFFKILVFNRLEMKKLVFDYS